ncbi:DUF2279 domain-containing protein [bacterium AH-315-M05]|nr:DUF2279 domain-containing protein [bacterium AH-315-M05]
MFKHFQKESLGQTSNDSPQNDSLSFLTPSKQYNSKRFTGVVVSEGVLSSLSLVGLNKLWYSGYPRSSFHFFNDNDEWLQVDKVGHVVTAWYVGKVGMDLLKWSGVERKKAIWYGGSLGFIFLTAIEILDGFSAEWGASAGDLGANLLGSALLIGQELGWDEQRIVLKYSFHQTPLAKYRPRLLGSSLSENLLKDYNGQTYWMSVNIYSFLHEESRFLKWLNISFGYGAYGMTGGSNNPTDVDGKPIPYFERYRQYYLSLDIDLARIPTRSKFLKTCFSAFGFIKIPFPTLEYNKIDGIVLHPFYF